MFSIRGLLLINRHMLLFSYVSINLSFVGRVVKRERPRHPSDSPGASMGWVASLPERTYATIRRQNRGQELGCRCPISSYEVKEIPFNNHH
jgi:hypothetical protein